MQVKKITTIIIMGIALFTFKGAIATEALLDEESLVTFIETGQPTTFEWSMNGGEVVVAARMNVGDEIPTPIKGLVFPTDAAKKRLKLFVEISQPGVLSHKDTWRVHWGGRDDRTGNAVGYTRPSDPDEEMIPVRILPVPINVEGLRVYIIPYRVVGDGVDSLVIAIASDKEKIQKHVKLKEFEYFDWDESFDIARASYADQKEEGEGD